MNKNYHKVFTPLMIVILMLLAIFSNLLYSYETRIYSYLNPVVGVATAFYYIHRKKTVMPIFITFFASSLILRILTVDESFWFSFAYCLVLFIPILVMMTVFTKIQERFKIGSSKATLMNTGYVLPYLLNIVLTSLVGTILMFLTYNAFIDINLDQFTMFKNIFFSNFFGMFLFNMTIFFAVTQDFHVFKKRLGSLFNIIFLLLFGTLSVLIFRDVIPNFDFEHFSFLFYFLFIVIGLLFSYRILILSNIIYTIVFGGYAFLFGTTSLDYFYVLTEVSLFLLVANLSAVSIKMMIIIYLHKSEKEKDTANTIFHLVDTTNRYIGEIDSLNNNAHDFFKRFLIDFFNIGLKLLPKFEKASCYILEDNKILYVSSKGYDINLLNNCDFDPSTFSWNFEKPAIINGYNDVNISARSIEHLNLYKSKYSNIKQSLTFSLDYAGFQGAMSFDIFDYNDYIFDQEDINTFKTFHRLVNSYMSMGSLYVESSKMKTDIILSMVKTLGFYDNYTRNHSIDVSNLAKELCTELGCDSKTRELAYYSSIVHDIGKIGISNEILNKKTRLTDKEFALIKTHPEQGYNILSEVKDLEEIAIIVKHHHERWDGRGYPEGLKGNKIPWLSQVIGVCDSVSAMLSKRVYQDAKTIQEVIDELKACRGKQFSPIPCDAMIKVLEKRGLV